VLAFDTKKRFLYGFDFGKYVWPPRIAPGERELVEQQLEAAGMNIEELVGG